MASNEGRSRTTIIDVAQAAGVSRQTVSNAVNQPDRVRPDTLARVLSEIERLDYRASSAARTLRHQRAGAVGTEINALTDTPSDVAFPFLVALTVAAPQHQCHMVPFAARDTFPTLAGYQDMVRRRLVDAFVLSDTHPGDPRPGWLEQEGIPYAAFGRVYDDREATAWADVDGGRGTTMAVEHVLSRGYGQIAYLGWPSDHAVGDSRQQGWHEATARHNGTQGPVATTTQDLAEAVLRAHELLNGLAPGDAVVCASDVLAMGVRHAALQRGWHPGRDLGITGFDGSATARAHGITTLAQPLDLIADHLLALVHHQLAGDPAPPEGALFIPTLMIGDSTDPSKEGTI
ncbi:MAG: LacI family DNA-binding transcriptional regulator [Ornithinimicrobium sp.]